MAIPQLFHSALSFQPLKSLEGHLSSCRDGPKTTSCIPAFQPVNPQHVADLPLHPIALHPLWRAERREIHGEYSTLRASSGGGVD